MFIFANFVQKANIQRSQFEKVNVSLSEFLRFILGSLLELGKNCLKIPKAPLDEYFYHWNILFYFFCTKNRLWPISVSECGRGTCLDFFFLLMNFILFDDLFAKIWNIIVFWIFRIFEIFWFKYWTGGNIPQYTL